MPAYKKRLGGDVCAIFVHAGAGYHSVLNEKVHLQACADAAKVAMTFLKNGGTAVDAVEAAIKVLEDKEITNAGYGSNLAIDGNVECDATIVDHLGRSGAAGAVGNIANPIHLARLILEHSTKPLSLRRVPPNLLVGQGATDFASECGMPVLPNDFLVSPGARERWMRWSKDLKLANQQEEGSEYSDSSEMTTVDEPAMRSRSSSQPAHSRQLSGLRNESQPFSPQLTPAASSDEESSAGRRAKSPGSGSYRPSRLHETTPAYHQLCMDSSPSPKPFLHGFSIPSPQGNDGQSSYRRNDTDNTASENDDDDTGSFIDTDPKWVNSAPPTVSMGEARPESDQEMSIDTDQKLVTPSNDEEDAEPDQEIFIDADPKWANSTPPTMTKDKADQVPDHDMSIETDTKWTNSAPPTASKDEGDPECDQEMSKSVGNISLHSTSSSLPAESQLDGDPSSAWEDIPSREDNITDTVGAIAVDCFGYIAAGSSSGGIGMKHKGRTGPAALVGIGTSVVPIEPDDKNKTCTAAVCSGTGEHMATTSASNVCANRLYFNQKKGRTGTILFTDEEGALRGFVEKDFMGHPSVKHSNSAGAIGVMAVKKTVDGLWLHFAHNTDSFALASMHSEELEPACVMSRGKGNGAITSGARSLRHPAPRASARKKGSSSRSSHAEEPTRVKRPRACKQTQ
ncbi:hypothetical protein MMC30_003644 [Trapelia coarctata]|nr:hypothetical protein [Trapelia coarctata]